MWAAAKQLGRPRSDTANVTWAGINAENAVRNAARVGVSDGREQRCEWVQMSHGDSVGVSGMKEKRYPKCIQCLL